MHLQHGKYKLVPPGGARLTTLTHFLGGEEDEMVATNYSQVNCIKTCVQLSQKDLCLLCSFPHRAGCNSFKSSPKHFGRSKSAQTVKRINCLSQQPRPTWECQRFVE